MIRHSDKERGIKKFKTCESNKKKLKAMGRRHTFWMVSGKVLKIPISIQLPSMFTSALILGLMINVLGKKNR